MAKGRSRNSSTTRFVNKYLSLEALTDKIRSCIRYKRSSRQRMSLRVEAGQHTERVLTHCRLEPTSTLGNSKYVLWIIELERC